MAESIPFANRGTFSSTSAFATGDPRRTNAYSSARHTNAYGSARHTNAYRSASRARSALV